MVKQNQYEFEADEIGIVYPIYGHMPPNMVRNFIREARLKAEYKFAVLTYGARKCDAAEIWNDLSAKAGNAFDYIATLVMVDNWLPNFDMNEQVKMDKRIPENLRRIAGEISRRRHWLGTRERRGTADARRVHGILGARSRGRVPQKERKVFYRYGCLYRLRGLYGCLSARELRADLARGCDAGRLRFLFRPASRTVRRRPSGSARTAATHCWHGANETRMPDTGTSMSR